MLIIVRGLPGSGKSTFARKYYPGLFHVENDQYWMHNGIYEYDDSRRYESIKWSNDLVDFALSRGVDCIVTTCCLRKKDVDYYIGLAEHYNHSYHVVYCDYPFLSDHDVPNEVMEKFRSLWEPHPEEMQVDYFIGTVLNPQPPAETLSQDILDCM